MQSFRVLLLSLVLLPAAARADICNQVHSKAMDRPMVSGNWYYVMDTNAKNVGDHGIGYYPIPVSATEAGPGLGLIERASWLTANKAHAPIYKPFHDANVGVTAGWMYNENDGHNGLDYANAGKTFEILAPADGEVVHVGYMPSPGNVVILEHTAPDGYKFRTVMHHLRNGRDSDIALARLTMKHSATYGYGWEKDTKWAVPYQKLADDSAAILQKNNPTQEELLQVERNWGTNLSKIFVKKGDKVKAGQVIGWAGRTGMHQTGVHLHIMFAREAEHRVGRIKRETRWTLFDPYGLYAGPSKECYTTALPSGMGTNQHASIYAPTTDDFLGISPGLYQQTFNYFASVGWGPRVLSYSGDGVISVSGSFGPTNGIPITRLEMDFNGFQAEFVKQAQAGNLPMQVSASSVTPHYAAIFGPHAGGYDVSHKLTRENFVKKFSENFSTHLLQDFSVYHEGGQVFFFAVWLKKAHNGYSAFAGMTEDDLKAKDGQARANGLGLVKLERYYDPQAKSFFYAGLWMPNPKALAPLLNFTKDQFFANRVLQRLAGNKLQTVHGIGNSYCAVFRK